MDTSTHRSTSLTPGAPSFSLATPHNSTSVDTPFVSITACTTVKDTCKWLLLNRFGQYCSHFTNYAGHDLLRLSRRDLMQLCGHADGIRLFNSLRNTTLKTIYVRLLPEDKGQAAWGHVVQHCKHSNKILEHRYSVIEYRHML